MANLKPLPRHRSDRVITGLSGGLGRAIGVDSVLVRVGFFVLTLGFGAGLALYLVLYALSRPQYGADIPVRDSSARYTTGLVLITSGALIAVNGIAQGFAYPLIVINLAGSGGVLLWRSFRRPEQRQSWEILLSAVYLVAAFTFVPPLFDSEWTPILTVVLSVLIVGLVFVFGARFIVRQRAQLGIERRERIRSQERSELSAQLHDSVLQTLALVQRSPDLEQAQALARNQERQLRSWMLGEDGAEQSQDVTGRIKENARKVERNYSVVVDVVCVGHGTINNRLQMFVDAINEATQNAAKHSGVKKVSVFAEFTSELATAFVHDEGNGFDADQVSELRRGIEHSIIGRMQRAGGSATITSVVGEGTDVELRLPLESSDAR